MNQTTPLPSYAPLAEVVRSGMREGVHYGAVVGLSAEGEIAYARGPVHDPMFPRSSAKPFQALAMLRAGARLEGASLAIAAGSHGGEEFHAAEAERILAAAGLTADALQCPPDVPGAPTARKAFIAAERSPERRYMNCSGKHAGMLAACVAQGGAPTTTSTPSTPSRCWCVRPPRTCAGKRSRTPPSTAAARPSSRSPWSAWPGVCRGCACPPRAPTSAPSSRR